MSNASNFMRLPVISWVVVANRAEAAFFRGEKNGPVEFLNRVKNEEPARNTGKVALSPRVNLGEEQADKFAKVVAEKMEQGCHHQRMDEFILLAEPHFLGLLRKHLSPKVAGLIRRELPLDLKVISTDEVNQRIQVAA